MILQSALCATLLVLFATSLGAAADSPADLHDLIQNFQSDQQSLMRVYAIEGSSARRARLDTLYVEYQAKLKQLDFGKLPLPAQADYVLLDNELERERAALVTSAKVQAQLRQLAPFADEIIGLEEARVKMQPLDPAKAARTVTDLAGKISAAKDKLKDAGEGARTYGYSALGLVGELRRAFDRWYGFYNGYDPLFSWWMKAPYDQANRALADFEKSLNEMTTGGKNDALIGRAVGREALLQELQYEMIPYTPEELIAIGEKEYAWCLAEMLKASRDLGYGDDWKAALEHVKQTYVAPGEQPKLIEGLAREAIDFVEKRDLVTVPELAKETWRMDMLSPEAQLVSPFFLGGETILVSYPTDTMTEDQKLMSMRGNNPNFSRATVQHELIPGHHLQGFMEERYRPYRQLFWTPFWVEGWAVYWEMLLWDLGFPQTPEQRIGMLFWRMHRCVRIIFSLKFHLGEMTPQQCVDMLVDRVGHERANAEGEVRRSFNGSYPPLYQVGYMIGALQIRALHRELVDSKKMTNRQFHDAILHENNIPIAVLREILEGKVAPGRPIWKFYE